jgi:hypothetical protein
MTTQIRQQLAALNTVAHRHGYSLEYHPTTKVRGWPAPSARPFALRTYDSGAHVASFETLDALERGFRARAGL